MIDYDIGIYKLYSYLRRSSKIVKCPEHDDMKYRGYYIVYDNKEAFDRNKIEYVVSIFRNESIDINYLDEVQKVLYELSIDKDIVIAFPAGTSFTFIKLSELIRL